MEASMKRADIVRKSGVTADEIAREHLQGPGSPVVITDGIESWPARSKWTFDFFKKSYGSDLASAWLGVDSPVGKITKLATYIDFLDKPSEPLPGIWIGKDGLPLPAAPKHEASPPYLIGWNAFQHAELYDDITPAPYFVSDLVSALSPTLREMLEQTSGRAYTAIYMGPAGSLSRLHRDYWKTHAYLAQIKGRKRATLFSPRDTDFLYNGEVDPEQPDFDHFPLFAQATAHECVIGPGDTLLLPANWWHHVRGIEKSITVSHNFFNETNLTAYLSSILENLPRLVEGLEKSPKWREELGLRWRRSNFTT
jgi:Cupin-like domain